MVDKVRSELEQYLNPSFQLKDYVNGSTDSIENVQFVYITDGIEIEETEEVKEAPQAEKGFVEKFLSLFGF